MTDRLIFVLAAIAAAGAGARFDPVRLQKFFFLLDRELDGECGCPHFDFQPYRYGPFDPNIYRLVEDLARDGLALVDTRRRYRQYGLTVEGTDRGVRAMATMPEHVQIYFRDASRWVLSLEFRELLAAVYEYAPDMAVRSVIPPSRPSTRRDGPVSAFLGGMAQAFDWGAAPSGGRRPPSTTESLEECWAAVGDYLREAVDREGTRVERSAGVAGP